jgi:murein DD-endopeptidase MepM/ murein hydrolase activator NlpD
VGTSLWSLIGLSALFMAVVAAAGIWYGYQFGLERGLTNSSEQAADVVYQQLEEQRAELVEERGQTRSHLDALALRLGEMQSEVLRINALGQRLAEASNLDADEFNFSEIPARGGTGNLDTGTNQGAMSDEDLDFQELVEEMKALSRSIEDRERKLSFLEELLMNRQLQEEIFPTGSPVANGWISSLYGYRKDPFTGKRSFHNGIDIAGREGAKVTSVASGVVVYSGSKGGFGEVVEIRHGNGYSTRYAHNKKLFVETGDLVTKGQVISLLGNTGRSTGPHVHFEVSYNGKTVDPQKFMKEIH